MVNDLAGTWQHLDQENSDFRRAAGIKNATAFTDIATELLSGACRYDRHEVYPKQTARVIRTALDAWLASEGARSLSSDPRSRMDRGEYSRAVLQAMLQDDKLRACCNVLAGYAVTDAASACETRSRDATTVYEANHFLAFSAGELREAAEKGTFTATSMHKKCIEFLFSPVRDTYDRATSGSSGGRPMRSAEGQRVLDDLNTLLITQMIDIPAKMAPYEIDLGNTPIDPEAPEWTDLRASVETTTFLDIDQVAAVFLERMGLLDPEHVTGLADDYTNLLLDHTNTYSSDDNIAMSTLNQTNSMAFKAAAAWLYRHPEDLMVLFPEAVGIIDFLGTEIDLSDRLWGAILTLTQTAEANGHPGTAFINAVFQWTDFRTNLAHIVIWSTFAGPSAMSEHTAMKVQRLGPRQLAIQTTLMRALQGLHQAATSAFDIPCALTGVRPSEAEGRKTKWGRCTGKDAELGDAAPATRDGDRLTSDPYTSVLQFPGGSEINPCLDLWARAEAVGSFATHYYMSAKNLEECKGEAPAAETAPASALLAASVVCHSTRAAQGERQGVGHTAMSLQVAADLLDWAGDDYSGTSLDWEHMLRDGGEGVRQLALLSDYTGQFAPSAYGVPVAESDQSAFTPAMSGVCNQSFVSGYNVEVMDGAAFRMATCVHRACFTLALTNKQLLGGTNPNHTDCKCYDNDLLCSMVDPKRRAVHGLAPDAFVVPGNGTVSQGFNAPGSSLAVAVGQLTLSPQIAILMNGDDQVSKLPVTDDPRYWAPNAKRAMGDTGELPVGRGSSLAAAATAEAVAATPAYRGLAANRSDMSCLDNGMWDRLAIYAQKVIYGGNLLLLNNARTHRSRLAALVPSPKKCSVGYFHGSIVYTVITNGTGEVTQTVDPSSALCVSTIPETSVAGLCSHLSHVISSAANSQAVGRSVYGEMIKSIRAIMPNFADILRKHREKDKVKMAEADLTQEERRKRFAAPLSIWTGKLTIMDGTQASLYQAISEVRDDPGAPSIARGMADCGRLLLPKGHPVPTADVQWGKDPVANAVLLAGGEARKYWQNRLDKRKRENRTLDLSEWLRQRCHLRPPIDPDERPEDYAGQPVYELAGGRHWKPDQQIEPSSGQVVEICNARFFQPMPVPAPRRLFVAQTTPKLGGHEALPPQSQTGPSGCLSMVSTAPGSILSRMTTAVPGAAALGTVAPFEQVSGSTITGAISSQRSITDWYNQWTETHMDQHTRQRTTWTIIACFSDRNTACCWAGPEKDTTIDTVRRKTPDVRLHVKLTGQTTGIGSCTLSAGTRIDTATGRKLAQSLSLRMGLSLMGIRSSTRDTEVSSGALAVSPAEMELMLNCNTAAAHLNSGGRVVTNSMAARGTYDQMLSGWPMLYKLTKLKVSITVQNPDGRGWRAAEVAERAMNLRDRGWMASRIWAFCPNEVDGQGGGQSTVSEPNTEDLTTEIKELGGSGLLTVLNSSEFSLYTAVRDIRTACEMPDDLKAVMLSVWAKQAIRGCGTQSDQHIYHLKTSDGRVNNELTVEANTVRVLKDDGTTVTQTSHSWTSPGSMISAALISLAGA